MYSKLRTTTKTGQKLKHYHHISVTKDFKADSAVSEFFLNNCEKTQLCCPFVDFEKIRNAKTLQFYTDSSLNPDLGYGGIFKNHWFVGVWGRDFILKEKPSIGFQELFALVAGIMTWEGLEELKNSPVTG